MVKIFVSYSHDDEAVAQSIVGYLHKSYDDVWYDEKLHTGDAWWERIVGKIENCTHFIFLMSNESLKSDYCQKELAFAREKGKTILPIKARRSIDLLDNLKYLEALQICEMLGKVSIDSLNELYAAIIRKSGVVDTQPSLTEAHRQADLKLLRLYWGAVDIYNLRLLIHKIDSNDVAFDFSGYAESVSATLTGLFQYPETNFHDKRLQNIYYEIDSLLELVGDFDGSLDKEKAIEQKGEQIIDSFIQLLKAEYPEQSLLRSG